jgi:hypothetical protein
VEQWGNFVQIRSATEIRILCFYPVAVGYSREEESRQLEKLHSTLKGFCRFSGGGSSTGGCSAGGSSTGGFGWSSCGGVLGFFSSLVIVISHFSNFWIVSRL